MWSSSRAAAVILLRNPDGTWKRRSNGEFASPGCETECCVPPLEPCEYGPCHRVDGTLEFRLFNPSQCESEVIDTYEFRCWWVSSTSVAPNEFVNINGLNASVVRHRFIGTALRTNVGGSIDTVFYTVYIYTSDENFSHSSVPVSNRSFGNVAWEFLPSSGYIYGVRALNFVDTPIGESPTTMACEGMASEILIQTDCPPGNPLVYTKEIATAAVSISDVVGPEHIPSNDDLDTYPPGTPSGCAEPPGPVEGYVQPNGTGVRDSVAGCGSWVNRGNVEGPSDNSFTTGSSALLLNDTCYLQTLMNFENPVPPGALVTGVRVTARWRFRKVPSNAPINAAFLREMRIYTLGNPGNTGILGTERSEEVEMEALTGSPAWQEHTFGPDLWGQDSTFWNTDPILTAINNSLIGVEFWFENLQEAPFIPGREYLLDVDSIFMEIQYQTQPGNILSEETTVGESSTGGSVLASCGRCKERKVK